MLTGWQRERAVRRVLKGISRQRVVVWVPGAPMVVELVDRFEGVDEALATARMRGWVEILDSNMAHGWLETDNVRIEDLKYTEVRTTYKLTEAGWAAIQRTHSWILATFAVSLLALLVGGWAAWMQANQTPASTPPKAAPSDSARPVK